MEATVFTLLTAIGIFLTVVVAIVVSARNGPTGEMTTSMRSNFIPAARAFPLSVGQSMVAVRIMLSTEKFYGCAFRITVATDSPSRVQARLYGIPDGARAPVDILLNMLFTGAGPGQCAVEWGFVVLGGSLVEAEKVVCRVNSALVQTLADDLAPGLAIAASNSSPVAEEEPMQALPSAAEAACEQEPEQTLPPSQDSVLEAAKQTAIPVESLVSSLDTTVGGISGSSLSAGGEIKCGKCGALTARAFSFCMYCGAAHC